MAIEVKIPEVGESITEAQISKWLKREGDAVEKDEAVVELETDKVSVEAPAPASGVIGKILKKEGETANVGDVIAYIEESGAGKAQAKPEANGEASAKEKPGRSEEKRGAPRPEPATRRQGAAAREAAKKPAAAEGDGEPRVMPAARRILEEQGMRAADVEATGLGGRVLKEDAQRAIEARKAAPETREAPPEREHERDGRAADARAETAPGREEEAVPMSPMRRRIAERLVEVQQTAALLTTFNEIDMSAVMELRKTYRDSFEERYGVRLGFTSFFVKAAVEALKSVPAINASIRGDDIVYHNYYDIGIAVSTERGLVVPILRNAERLSFAEVEQRVGDFAKRAREKKLSLEELEGGTFTITNGGVFGSLLSTPIVNPPQSAILGLHAIQERPIALNGQVVIRSMMYVALTYDHRLVDGREAVTFLKRIKEVVEEPTRILLEI